MKSSDSLTLDGGHHARREIAAHFAGRASPVREAVMRAHLVQCASCRRRYDRHLLLARLDPHAPQAAHRIGRGLGIRAATEPRPPSAPPRRRWWFLLTVPAAVAAGIVLSVRLHPTRVAPDAGTWSARGPARAEPSLWVYRLPAGRPPQIVQGSIAATDELAFAYSNPGGVPRMLVFGVDEHRHVYWFHPAWGVGQPPPAAISARPGAGPHELPEAVRHDFDGSALTIYALFTDHAPSVESIEAAIRRNDGSGGELPFATEGTVLRRALQVQR